MSFNSVMKHSPLVKSKQIRKSPTDDYSRYSDDAVIEDAVKNDNRFTFGSIVKIEYIGTDWEMGSQYYAAMFKGGDDAEYEYYVSPVIDWSRENKERGAYCLETESAESKEEANEIFNGYIDRYSRGTRKSVRKMSVNEKNRYAITIQEYYKGLKEDLASIENSVGSMEYLMENITYIHQQADIIFNDAERLRSAAKVLDTVLGLYDYSDKSAKKSKRM